MPLRKFAISALFLICAPWISAQDLYDFGFTRSQNMAVYHENEQPFSFPWVGGINGVKLSEMDLNQDGILDLVVFEKHGNRIYPFLNQGVGNEIGYVFAPQYIHAFPPLHDWVILKDFNADGKADIFTYGLAGITVYENVSDNENLLFQLVTDQLQSFYYNSYSNLYASPDDYLAVEDLDGDGDLDILNFWVLGKYVHFHRNYSMENHGDCGHLDFRLESECWGHFEEGGEDNSIVLNSDCGAKDEPTRHVGSTFLVKDFNHDDLPDLVLGDMDFPNLLLLQNGGTQAEAWMISVDTLFPNQAQPIWIYSMPVPSCADVNNDGVDELFASPADPSLTKSQDLNSLWMYRWNAQSSQYEKVVENFLQGEMLDAGTGAFPVFYDWNQDGLVDMLVGNYGGYDSSRYINGFLNSYFSSSIAYYQNVGTQNLPAFKLISNDFGNLRRLNRRAMYPAFSDFTGDGVTDLLCGNADGTLSLFVNHGGVGEMPQFAEPQDNYASVDVGDFSTPQLFDLDDDGKTDLIVGNRRGKIAYYRNVSGGEIPDFQLVSDALGGVDVRDYNNSYFGFSVPHFFRNANDETVLFCGSERGYVFHYDLIDNNLAGNFRLKDSALVETCDERVYNIVEAVRCAPAVCDLNDDGFGDMVVGNYAGGLSLYMGTMPVPRQDGIAENRKSSRIKIHPNPARDYFQVEWEGGASAELQLFDLTGRVVLSQSISSECNRVNVSGLNAGMYVGRMVVGGVVRVFKVIHDTAL